MLTSLMKVLAILAAATAAAFVQARWQGLKWVESREAYQEQQTRKAQLADRLIDLDRFRELIDMGAAVIDVREADQFAEEHLDLGPGAMLPVLNVPPGEGALHLERLHALLSYTGTIVLYCNSATCPYSKELYIELQNVGFISAGFPDVYIYEDGWQGIEDEGLPTTSGPDTWTGGGFGEPMTDGSDPGEPNAQEANAP